MPNPCNNGGSCQQLGSYEYFCSCTKSCSGFNCNHCQANSTSPHSELSLALSNSTKTTYVSSTTSDTTIAGLSSTTTKKGISVEEHDDGESTLNSQCQDMSGKEFQCRYYAVVFDFCEKYSFINGMVFTGKFLKCLLA